MPVTHHPSCGGGTVCAFRFEDEHSLSQAAGEGISEKVPLNGLIDELSSLGLK